MALFRKRPDPKAAKATAPRIPQAVPAPPPPPEFLKDADIRTSLGPDAVISGKLSFTTPTRIEGTLKGELRCTRLLIIGPTAVVEGTVRAEELRIEGTVSGEILETGRVEIAASGRFRGRLQATALVIRLGGLFDGESRMGLTEGSKIRAGG